MSNLLDIAHKISETQDAIRKAEDVLKEFPNDSSLLATLDSLAKRASELEVSYLSQANRDHLDVCSYRIFAEDVVNYPIISIGSALRDFQRLFSTIYDALVNGAKRRARLTPETVALSTLSYGFSFSGSVGVALTIPSERMLVDNNLQAAMQRMVEMIKAESSDQVHFHTTELGSASVRALYQWADDHVKGGVGAEVRWIHQNQEFASIKVDAERLKNLERAILETSDEEETTFTLEGILVGADTKTHSFHMVFEEAEEIRGLMSENIGEEYTVELPKAYKAKIRKTASINYATEKESASYYLLALERIS